MPALSYRTDRLRYLEHGTPEWDMMWDRVRDELRDRELDLARWFDCMLYRGTWKGRHHFTSDDGLSPGNAIIEFAFDEEE